MESTLMRLKRVDVHGRGYGYGYELSGDITTLVLPSKDFVYVFFRGQSLSYWCVRVSSLLSSSAMPIESRLESDIESVGVYRACVGMCCLQSKNWIYLMGGYDDDGKTGIENEKTEYSDCTGMSPCVMRLAVLPPILTGDPSCCQRSPMHSGKGSSIAVEHNGIMYVLVDFFRERPKHTFEAYNPREDAWYVLKSPPIHDWGRKQYMALSYVVIGNKICVSTEKEAFAYDIDAKKWEPCHLFDGMQPFCGQQLWESAFQPAEFAFRRPRKIREELKGGPPFEFFREGILYESDSLISTIPREESIVGYWIDSGRVVGKQNLCHLPDISDLSVDIGSLVELGNGYFCITYTKFVEGVTRLVIVTFKVSGLTKRTKNRFLLSRVCSRHEIQVSRIDDVKFSIFSFAV